MTLPDQHVCTAARQSHGKSSGPILASVQALIADEVSQGTTLIDVGCGAGDLITATNLPNCRVIGLDAIRYDELPSSIDFHQVDLNAEQWPVSSTSGDIVCAIETIEHLENPRAFVRQLRRICRPGGRIIVTTPNNLSFLSKVTLTLKNQFNAFQDANYPAHITALLESDLIRVASEAGLNDVRISYSQSGRIPGSGWHWPGLLSRLAPRLFSDNIILCARRPADHT